MAKTTNKTLTFPLAGVGRRAVNREQSRPYTCPWAANVRGEDAIARRLRGGSRPGLVKVLPSFSAGFGSVTAIAPVTSIDRDGVRRRDLVVIAGGEFYSVRGTTVTLANAAVATCGGVAVETCDGQSIVFNSTIAAAGHAAAFDMVERAGKLYLADTTLKVFDPGTGVVSDVAPSCGSSPAASSLIALYRDRLFLSGANHVWYCSRQGNPTDWHYGADSGDTGRAVAGQVAKAGLIGDNLQALIPRGDEALVFAMRNEMWALRGDPTDGQMVQISGGIGVLTPQAWAMDSSGTVAFLSSDGVYMMNAGSAEHPKRWSEDRIPGELRNVDPTGKAIVMAYDAVGRGFHLFITPESGLGQHWWLDAESQAIWPVVLPSGMQPVAATRVQGDTGLNEVILGCRDGHLRKFSAAATTDDGTALASHALLGPFRIAQNDFSDAMIAEVHGIIGTNSAAVTCRVVMGNSAESVSETATAGVKAALAGTTPTGVDFAGNMAAGRNDVFRTRSRGPWAIIWLSSSGRWAFEAVAMKINQLGRLR